MPANLSPSDVLNKLSIDATSRKRRSLEIINDVCREQHERGSKDFSPATIGRLSEKAGGPSERTIRNKDGESYRALMRSWAEFSGGANKKPKLEKRSSIDDEILDRITDPVAKALIGQTLVENKKYKREIDLLKSKTNLVIDMRPKPQPAVNNGGQAVAITPILDLIPMEIQALQHAISDEFLKEQVWSKDEQGRIKAKNGRNIFRPGFVTALEKILKNAGTSVSQ